MRGWTVAVVGAMLAIFAADLPAAASPPSLLGHSSSAASQPSPLQDPPVVKPVDIVVLVDESGSISLADLEREREAASLIAQG
ncbi:MAG: hypothetical protein ACRDTT_34145, partial [Pseudonocardiaceae bacterium]